MTEEDKCIQNYYDFSMIYSKQIDKNNALYVDILPKIFPIEIITHSPAMTYEEYVANIGGLMGVYLGISLITIYDFLIVTLKYLLRRNRSLFCKWFYDKLGDFKKRIK